MSGLGSFITGAVGGYQDGANWKEGRLDRKRKRQIEDERFGREKENWKYQDEQKDWTRENRKFTVSERNREVGRRDEEEAFFKGLVDDPTAPPAGAAPETPPADVPLDGPRVIKGPTTAQASPEAPAMPSEPSAPGQTSPDPAATMGPPRRRAIKPPAPPPTANFFSQRADQIGAAPQVRNLAAAADVAQAALAQPELTPEDRQKADATVQAATLALEQASQAKAGPATPPGPATAGGAPEALYPGGATPAEMSQRQAPPQGTPMSQRYPDKQFPPGYLPEDQPRQPVAPTSADAPISIPSNQPRTIRMPEGRDMVARGMMTNTDRVPQEMRAGLADSVVAENRRTAAAPLAENRQYSALQPAPMPTPANPVPADKLPAVTPTTEEGTPQPSLDSATKTTPRTIKADGTVKPPSKAEAQRQQASFIEDYAKNQVPKIVKFYARRGEMDKAKAYQAWADDTLVKEAMKDWASAVHSASIGDDEGFIDGIVGAYNAKGYFDDAHEIVREASGIQRDKTGNITGAQVTFKDTRTGKIFTQEFDGSEDLYRLGVDMLSPEQVFEKGWERVNKADAYRDQVAQALAKKGLGTTIGADAVLKAMKTMGEANLNFQQLTVDDQVAQAVDMLRRFGGQLPQGVAISNPADVPVAARPKG